MRGSEIRSLRRSLALTQASLGLRIGVHGCTVGRWEREVHKPRPAYLAKLSELGGGPSAQEAPARVPNRPTKAEHSGQGWQVYTGDCLDRLPALPDGAFDALIADAPYCSGGLHLGTKQQKTQRKYQQNGVIFRRQDFDGDQRDQLAFIAFLTEALRRCARVVRRGGLVAVFSDWRQQGATQTAMQAAGFVLRGCAVWDKTEGARPVPSRLRNQAEFIHWGSKGDLPADRAIPTQGGVFRCPVRPADKFHLTGKPTEVMRWLVRQVRPAGRILDPFAGSGSTGVAALLEGRAFTGIELDPHNAQIAAQRLAAAERGKLLDARRLQVIGHPACA